VSLAVVAKTRNWSLAPPPEGNAQLAICVDGPDLSIQQLAERSRAGCRESFNALVECFEGRIYNFIYQVTRNQHDAEDLTQVTFLKAYQNIRAYETTHTFGAWLFTIAKRTALNHCRDRRLVAELPEDLESDSENPSLVLQRKDEHLAIWQLAKTLKKEQHEALWLRYGEGFSIAEVGRIMNTNSIRVRVLLHRARASLAKQIIKGNQGIPLRPQADKTKHRTENK
jgi:RNA polymerase sigma-70 factor (ECF subfamily)